MTINQTGNVGIGIAFPTARLHVVGSIRIVDGTQVNGYVLTTDANGKAIEADPAAGANNNIIGMALESGVDTDIKSVLISPSVKQGA